ncbi:hypothetical protein CSB45_13680 [candidate division KSB3 bacterium]|uniref:Uncharacterized protein n=1 Tax=candidate division KSB3 bacterium TaxID=2044937 RepID=A0A2G6E1N3_9BACT|nr:MAG: hypothetical protein CSB45_13680 [candidate division KSB3 bacterium]PIE28610.1 MAG: hypothetical protein CSA57_13330 [candidate division KSB3 bacterium]
MKPPTTYAEWVKYLKKFAEQSAADDELLAGMEAGKLSWIEGVGDKLSGRLNACFTKRLDDLQNKFHREQTFGSDRLSEFTRAIANLRARFRPLRQLANLPGFPDELKTRWDQHLHAVAQDMQNKLMEQLEERSKHEKRYEIFLVELKRNPIIVPGTGIKEKKIEQEYSKKPNREIKQENSTKRTRKLLI